MPQMPILDQRLTSRSLWRYLRVLTLTPMIKAMFMRSYNPYTAFDNQDTSGIKRLRSLLSLLASNRALQTQESLLMAKESL
jgi:hypothetical protein